MKRNINVLIIFIFSVCIMWIVYTDFNSVVNNEVVEIGIDIDDLEFISNMYYEVYENIVNESLNNDVIDYMEKKKIEQLIFEDVLRDNLIRDFMIQNGFILTEKEIDNEINLVLNEVLEEGGIKNPYDEDEINNDFYKYLAISNLYNRAFKDMIFEEVIENNNDLIEELFNNIIVEVRAKHILLNTMEEAEFIFKEIKEGKSFDDFIFKSIDNFTNNNGGDLGYFQRGVIINEIEQIAFNTSMNKVNKPFKSEFGYHILVVTDIMTTDDMLLNGVNEERLEHFRYIIIQDLLKEYSDNILNEFYNENIDVYENLIQE